MTGCQGTEALAFARRKRSSGPFTSGLTPQDRRDDLQLTAAVRALLQVEIEHPLEHHLARGVCLHTFVGPRRAGALPAGGMAAASESGVSVRTGIGAGLRTGVNAEPKLHVFSRYEYA